MFKLTNDLLPAIFADFFKTVDSIHNYNTRLATQKAYYLPTARTNYGLFNIRVKGTKVWNAIDEDIKHSTFKKFKYKLQNKYLADY